MASRKRKKPSRSFGLSVLALLTGIGLVGVSLFMQRQPPIAPEVALIERKPAAAPAPKVEQQAVLAPMPPQKTASAIPAWRQNAVEVGPENGQPMIAIVIDDMGVDHARSERAIELPAPLTMSFMAYAADLPAMTAAAHSRGHELMLHIPMQPLSASVSPGPHALTTDLSDDELRARLEWDLDRLTGIAGANNHMGSRFTEWTHGMEVVEQVLHERGLFVLDSRTTPRTVVIEVAEKIGMPHARRNVFLDDEMSAGAVDASLAKTEETARQNGFAIAIGHPHDATIAALRAWLPMAAKKGFHLVPVSAIVMHNEIASGRDESAAD